MPTRSDRAPQLMLNGSMAAPGEVMSDSCGKTCQYEPDFTTADLPNQGAIEV